MMTKRITDEQLDAMVDTFIGGYRTREAMAIKQLRARVRGLEELTDDFHKYHRLYDALRDAVLKMYNAHKKMIVNCECSLCEYFNDEGGGDSPQGNKLTARPTEKTGELNRDQPALDCSTCGGRGWIQTWECKNCGGTGKEPKE